jgi:hypothetical protein
MMFGGSMRVVSSCLLAVLIAVSADVPASAAEEPVRLDVGLAVGADPAAVVADLGGGVTYRPIGGLNAIALDVPASRSVAVLAELTARPDIRYAQDGGVTVAAGDPYDSSNKMRLDQATVPAAWKVTTGSERVIVAVVDSGVLANADLGADRLVPGRDIIEDDDDVTDSNGSHGTLVANLIGAAENGVGSTGVCQRCSIMPVRVLETRSGVGSLGTTADAAAGIVWAADHGADIINMSFTTTTESGVLRDAVRYAAGKDAVLIAGAGQTGDTQRRYPAAFDEVIAVAASRDPIRNTLADRWTDLQAEAGYLVMNAKGNLTSIGGTSSSAAVASGVAGLVLSIKPEASAREVRDLIIKAARPPLDQVSYAPPLLDALGAVTGTDRTDRVAPVVYPPYADGQLFGKGGRGLAPSATDNVAVARYELLVDGVLTDSVERSSAPPWWLRWNKPDGFAGDVTLTVRAYDHAGNRDESTSTVRVDAVGPTATIVSPEPGAHLRGAIPVVISSADEDLKSVTVGGVPMARQPGTHLWKASVPPPSSGFMQVSLLDNAGNSLYLDLYFIPDNAGPVATSMSPVPNARFRGNFTATITGVSDAGGVAKAELWANGKYVGADSVAPYSLTVRPGPYSGTVNLRWRLTDRPGNTRDYTRQVIADNKAPTVSISAAPKNKAKIKGTTKVYVKASDAGGIARVELIVNGKVVARDHTAGYVLAFNASKQAKTMKVQVRAYDKVGNVKSTSTRTWYRK